MDAPPFSEGLRNLQNMCSVGISFLLSTMQSKRGSIGKLPHKESPFYACQYCGHFNIDQIVFCYFSVDFSGYSVGFKDFHSVM